MTRSSYQVYGHQHGQLKITNFNFIKISDQLKCIWESSKQLVFFEEGAITYIAKKAI